MSIYAGVAVTTLKSWLADAQAALPVLITGKQTVSVALGDKRVAFTPAQVADLRRHITELQTAIAAAESAGSAVALAGTSRRPILPWV